MYGKSAQEIAVFGITGGGTAVGWLMEVNEWLQFVSLIVSILVGGIAIYSFWKRRKDESKKGGSE